MSSPVPVWLVTSRAESSARNRSASLLIALVAMVAMILPVTADAASLRGSRHSMKKQHTIARANEYSFLRSSSQVKNFVSAGYLVPVRTDRTLELANVSYPYARPELKLFLDRLSSQYRAACGERLVVTSLTRPQSRQPRNASPLSVHPAGMAVDLRISRRSSCRSWLERTLLSLERQGVLDVTRERRPPHYHVALFPQRYNNYVAQLEGRPQASRRATRTASSSNGSVYRVSRGDTLWEIAKRSGVSVSDLKRANALRSNQIKPGQTLQIPAR